MKNVNVAIYQKGYMVTGERYSIEQLDHMVDVKMTLSKKFIDDQRNEKSIDNVNDAMFYVSGDNSFGVNIAYKFIFNMSKDTKNDIMEKMNACVLSVKREISI